METNGFSKWVNKFPNNVTQNRYTRFVRKPGGALETPFTRKMKEFEQTKGMYQMKMENPFGKVGLA
jgi:hypothetical protein